MPIILKDLEFSQTDSHIVVSVNFPKNQEGLIAPHNKPEVYLNECYLKVTATPYFFELDLYHDVDCVSSKCTISHDQITWILEKRQKGQIWPQASVEGLTRAEKMGRRDLGHQRLLAHQDKDAEDFRNHRGTFKRDIISEQMKIETRERESLEAEKSRIKESLVNGGKNSVQSPAKPSQIQELDDIDEMNFTETSNRTIITTTTTTTTRTEKTMIPPSPENNDISSEFQWETVVVSEPDHCLETNNPVMINSIPMSTAALNSNKKKANVVSSIIPGVRSKRTLDINLQNTNANSKLSHVARTRVSAEEDFSKDPRLDESSKENNVKLENDHDNSSKDELNGTTETIPMMKDVNPYSDSEPVSMAPNPTETLPGKKTNVPDVKIMTMGTHEKTWQKVKNLLESNNYLAAMHILDQLIGTLSQEMMSRAGQVQGRIPPLLLVKALLNKVTISLILPKCDLIPSLADCELALGLLQRRKQLIYGDGSLEFPFKTDQTDSHAQNSDKQDIAILMEKIYVKWGAILVKLGRQEQAMSVWRAGIKDTGSEILDRNLQMISASK